MSSTPRDYSVFDKFNFERKPVGVKFLITKPEGIRRLDKELNFCEMFKEAQEGSPFYVTEGDFHCIEPLILGMEDPEPMIVSGLVGETDELYDEARANRKIYQYLPKMLKGSVKYVVFSPIDQLNFDPDVLIVTANAGQAQLILRALAYSSGDPWSCKGTPVAACSWIYIHPVISGELNFTITGIGVGMRALQVFPAGLIIISIPWTKLPMIMENLEKMRWTLVSDTLTAEENKKRFKTLFEDLRQKAKL